MNFAVVNLGCKVNRVESDSFERAIVDGGGNLACESDADVVIVNTCTVTSMADKKTRKTVRGIINHNSNAHVIVTGCATAKDSNPFSEMSERVEVVQKADVIDTLSIFLTTSDKLIDNDDSNSDECLTGANDRVRKGVKIQDGCTNACTYCIIWQVRGPLWSASVEDVIRDVNRLANEGVSEIMLTGINLGKYVDLCSNVTLVELLRILLDLNLPIRYRLSSIEPPEVTEELIALIADSDGKICRHLHIPLQSGSSKVLSEMGRLYTRDEFIALVNRIRHAIPNVALTTDVIVGFPGESDSDFEDTVSLVRECGFSKVHVFPYSQREGTPAAKRLDQIDSTTKTERAKILRTISDELSREDLLKRTGTTEQAVVITDGIALTESYYEVTFDVSHKIGDIIKIKL